MLVNVVIAAVCGLVLLVLLWPVQSTAQRLLKRWDVPDPTPAQFEEAIRYLRRRRLLPPLLFAVVGFVPSWGDNPAGQIAVIVLAVATYLSAHQQWNRVVLLGLSAAAVGVIIWAVVRPASGDEVVDLALRTRSVDLSAGPGAGLVDHPVGFLGLLAWIAMAGTTPRHLKISG
ncbi:hypothetical protein [Lentzea sp. NPDC060358]|uniref:hypothetical protein n=1 Tax=Lentzea sp. NPDC060358 TaxID=3347103 RepID=UPI00364F47D2